MANAIKKTVTVEHLGRDRAELELAMDGANVKSMAIKASGCRAFLQALATWKNAVMAEKAGARTTEVLRTHAPKNEKHEAILIRELADRALDRFELPYKDEELCHCRAVPTAIVDRAIVAGCHTVAAVARMTSAGTSCGTCKPDTESIIRHRLK